jgi:hypothetical protein
MTKAYTPPARLPDETNEQWCDRYVASMPAEALLSEIIATMHNNRKRRGPAWSQIGYYTGHGSGVSSAIVKRFMPSPCPDEAIR